MIPIKIEAQIREKVKAGRSPMCAECGTGSCISAAGKVIYCAHCNHVFKDLKEAWRRAWQLAVRRRVNAESNVK